MSDKNTRTLRSESSAVSLTMELSNLEHALRGASLLAELLANHELPDEETQRMAPHCITAQLVRLPLAASAEKEPSPTAASV